MDDRQFYYLLILSIVTLDFFPIISLKIGITRINFTIFLNSFTTLYPLLGYYLDSHGDQLIKTYMYPVMAILTGAGLTVAVQMTIWNYEKFGNWDESYIVLFCTATAITVFLSVKKIIYFFETNNLLANKIVQFIQYASGTMFGIYLLENILETLTKPLFILLDQFIPRIVACILYLIATMLIGNIIIGLLKRIPGLRKLL